MGQARDTLHANLHSYPTSADFLGERQTINFASFSDRLGQTFPLSCRYQRRCVGAPDLFRFVLRPVVCLRPEMRRCCLRSCLRGLASARTEQSGIGSVGPGIVSFTSSEISDRRWRASIIWRTARPPSVMSQPPLARSMSFCEKMSRFGTRSPSLLVRSNPDRWSPD